ncbi:MAG TPA: CHAT domain-containing protein, partial [Bacteroidetes bacterium]|nr:CHAT domain-containing protein [Bacteroidota bacterium]
ILLLSQWNANERDKRAGIISYENYKMYVARVSNALNEYIDDLSEDDLRKVLAAADLKPSTGDKDTQSSNFINVTGDNNTIIHGNTDSDVTIIKDSKNVVSGSQIQADGDVHIGDGVKGNKLTRPEPSQPNKNTNISKEVILFIAANPSKEAKINLRIEHSTISEELEGKTEFEFRSKMAASRKELNMQVVDKEPTILHFSGHGIPLDPAKQELLNLGFKITEKTGLVFHNKEKNGTDTLNAQKSEQIFKGLKAIVPNLNIVILNACYSEAQAIAISKNGIYTIGVNNKILDVAAIAFAQGFYWRYANTRDIKAAIIFGILQANLELGDDVDANNLIHLFYNGQKIQL